MTALTNTRAAPHIGHLHSLVVADIFARYSKLVNPLKPVHFVTGTDEHGLKIQNAAKAKGMDPLAFCDELSEHFRVCTPVLHFPRHAHPHNLATKAESHQEG